MEAGEGDGDRRRLSSSRRKSDSSNNLRSLLRVRDDENDGRTNVSRVTLSAVLSADKRRSPVRSRTLLDIIQDEPFGDRDDKNSWKQLKYMLGLRRAGAAWTSTIQIPTSEVPIQQNGDRMIGQSHSVQLQDAATPTAGTGTDESTQPEMPASSSSNTANNGVDSRPESNPSLNNRATIQRQNSSRISDSRLTTGNINVAESVGQNQEVHSTVTGGGIGGTAAASTGAVPDTPARMSLMALLAESDRQLGLEGSEFMMVDDDNQEDELVEASAGGGGGLAGGGADRNSCCVCMLRHKGAAFIPCGHTFCRLCSRELWVQRVMKFLNLWSSKFINDHVHKYERERESHDRGEREETRRRRRELLIRERNQRRKH